MRRIRASPMCSSTSNRTRCFDRTIVSEEPNLYFTASRSFRGMNFELAAFHHRSLFPVHHYSRNGHRFPGITTLFSRRPRTDRLHSFLHDMGAHKRIGMVFRLAVSKSALVATELYRYRQCLSRMALLFPRLLRICPRPDETEYPSIMDDPSHHSRSGVDE